MPNYCISTSTPGMALYVNGNIANAVTDEQGFPVYATTTCPAVISEVHYITDNPAQNLFDGIVLFMLFFCFMTWYFISRFKLT